MHEGVITNEFFKNACISLLFTQYTSEQTETVLSTCVVFVEHSYVIFFYRLAYMSPRELLYLFNKLSVISNKVQKFL